MRCRQIMVASKITDCTLFRFLLRTDPEFWLELLACLQEGASTLKASLSTLPMIQGHQG